MFSVKHRFWFLYLIGFASLPFSASLFPAPASGQQTEVLTILHNEKSSGDWWIEWSGGGYMLVQHLNRLAKEGLVSRQALVDSLDSPEQWRQRQAYLRSTFAQIIGPWPERTPLNAEVTGTIEKTDYRVEKIVFESMPGFHVTGALFMPKGMSQPRPAILKVIGHSDRAFRREIYQNVILNLVHKGFIVFAIDPLGQGERLQYFDDTTKQSVVGSSTQEHSHAGVQCFLIGKSLARYFTWDGIRAIDYLCSRPEVDASRIGVTGLSGGGTQTSYIGAVDPRVVAAAPMGFVTSINRLLESIGPQDAEQVLYHGTKLGIEHADLLTVRAPRPTLHVSTTRDFFSIQGARETEVEVKRAFELLGKPDNYRRVEDDYEHGFTKQNNEATYAFFQNALNLPGDKSEATYEFLTEQELQVTSTGQVATAYNSLNVSAINRREASDLFERLQHRRTEHSFTTDTVRDAKRLSGFEAPTRSPDVVFRGQYQRDGYRVEKWAILGAGKTVLPLLLFVPDGSSQHQAIIYADASGKQAQAGKGQEVESLVRNGFIVASVDLLGYGETAYAIKQGHAPYQPFFNAILSGNSVCGINASDMIRVLLYLQSRKDVVATQIGAVGRGDSVPAVIHAFAFDQRIAWLVTKDGLLDYRGLVEQQNYQINPNCLVAGALTGYDLPDLLAAASPRRIAISSPRNALGIAATEQQIATSLELLEVQHNPKPDPKPDPKFRLFGANEPLSELVMWASQASEN